MPDQPSRRGPVALALVLILALATGLRLYGLDFGLPYLYQPDEPNKVEAAQNILKSGNLNPHYFKKPTLLIYANAALYVPYYLWGKAEGRFRSPADIQAPDRPLMGTGYIGNPDAMVMGRALTALLGVLAVFLTWAVGRRFFASPWVPVVAALAVAVSPEGVRQSHFIETNIYLVVAALGVLWAALRVYERGSGRDYLLAGFMVGIAVTCKYPGVVAIAFPFTAHWLRAARKFPIDGHLKLLCLMVPVGFLLGTPYALLDPKNFFLGATHEAGHYATGHEGLEGNTLLWYLNYAVTVEGPLMAVFLVAAVAAWRARNDKLLLLASFPAVYWAFISVFQVRNGRTFLPLTPFAFLLAVGFLFELGGRWRTLAPAGKRALALAALVVAMVSGLAVPFAQALAYNREFVTVDGRETSRQWIEANLPAGSAIALESYSPYLRPERYRLTYLQRAVDSTAAWYRAQGIEYLIFSEGMYGRYVREPDKYPDRLAAYQALWDSFPEVKRWTDGGYEIQLHRVR
ncbi:MAG: glycosyltransferase family 39 protein [Gemmatimonadetes bacterium]|nr:glycosyltransferase family 39 protein [Gemmatimonadota bacterium]